jgi:hypothetical protein
MLAAGGESRRGGERAANHDEVAADVGPRLDRGAAANDDQRPLDERRRAETGGAHDDVDVARDAAFDDHVADDGPHVAHRVAGLQRVVLRDPEDRPPVQPPRCVIGLLDWLLYCG